MGLGPFFVTISKNSWYRVDVNSFITGATTKIKNSATTYTEGLQISFVDIHHIHIVPRRSKE